MSAAGTAAQTLAKRALELHASSGNAARRRAVTEAVNQFKRSASDTGSPEVQIALLSKRIAHLTEHLKVHRKDFNSTKSVVALVNKRRTQMQYLLRKNPETYADVVQRLGLRPSTVFSKDVSKGAKTRPTPRISIAPQ